MLENNRYAMVPHWPRLTSMGGAIVSCHKEEKEKGSVRNQRLSKRVDSCGNKKGFAAYH